MGESIQEKAEAAALHRRLIRNRRNISWYKQHSDFWAWYKYFTDNGNQEAVSVCTNKRTHTHTHYSLLSCRKKCGLVKFSRQKLLQYLAEGFLNTSNVYLIFVFVV